MPSFHGRDPGGFCFRRLDWGAVMNPVAVWLPFGRSGLNTEIMSSNLLGVFGPRENSTIFDEATLLRQALEQPIGTPPLRHLARPGQKVVIVTSDFTRPCPSRRMLPAVVEELAAGGISDTDITVVIALGLHRAMTAAELKEAVGAEIYRRVRVINHDPGDTVLLGFTSAGTPVEIFRPVVAADLRVCLGNLEFHYFAGFSGGAKAVLPGCASRAAVTSNHAMMVRPEAAAGRLTDNPLRVDIEEGVKMLGVDFIVNVVVDGDHRIVAAVAGDVQAAHRCGCELVRARGSIPIPQRADIVLVSAGGHPSDANLYQAQKALDNAACAVKEGGIIIWVAECSEGFGNQTFESWLRQASSAEEILDRIQVEFVLGGHKAAAVAAVLRRARIFLVSALSFESMRDCGLVAFRDLKPALEKAFTELGAEAEVVVLPRGGSVFPLVLD